MIHFITKAKQTEKDLCARFADDKFAEWEAQVIDALDVDFSLVRREVHTMEEFEQQLKAPFLENKEKIFYRGERVDDRARPLIPTIFRNRQALFDNGDAVAKVTADFVYDFYSRDGSYMHLYEKVMDPHPRQNLYRLFAFSQHYLDVSPFVDFTKSLYVSLSFALKNRQVYPAPLALYTVKIRDEGDYTESLATANAWLEDYKVYVFRRREDYIKSLMQSGAAGLRQMLRQMERERQDMALMGNAPSAKLIGIPTNDLMRYQQGVFLLLTDFSLMFNGYPTKNIREDFEVTKWILDAEICPALLQMIEREAPWYNYDCLLDVKTGFEKAAKFDL